MMGFQVRNLFFQGLLFSGAFSIGFREGIHYMVMIELFHQQLSIIKLSYTPPKALRAGVLFAYHQFCLRRDVFPFLGSADSYVWKSFSIEQNYHDFDLRGEERRHLSLPKPNRGSHMHSISKSAQALLNQVHGGTDLGRDRTQPSGRHGWKNAWKNLKDASKIGGVGFTTVIVVQHSDEKHCAGTFQWWTPLHLELWQTQNLLCFWRQEDQRLSKPNLHSKAVAFFGDPLLYV